MHQSSNSPISTRPLLTALFLVSIVCQIDRILPFALAESIKRDLSLTDTDLGLLTGLAFAVCNSIMSLPLARLADRGSPRRLLIACVTAWSIMTSLGGFASNFLTLSFTRFGVALGEAGAIPAGHSLIARHVAVDRRGSAIGLFSLGIPLGTMVGFALGGRIGDVFGWRIALMSAGGLGLLLAIILLFALPESNPRPHTAPRAENFFASSKRLFAIPAFRWLFLCANILGFSSAPFYAFAVPFLIRTFSLSATTAGLAFGLLQGFLGILGMLLGGRGFDHEFRRGSGQLLRQPARVFLLASFTTPIALFAPVDWLALLLLIPVMFSFTYLLPWAFGAAHFVAGQGNQALASSVTLLGSSLFGPALAPLLVGMISDFVASQNIPNSLRYGLLLVPVATFLLGAAMLVTNQRLASFAQQQTTKSNQEEF